MTRGPATDTRCSPEPHPKSSGETTMDVYELDAALSLAKFQQPFSPNGLRVYTNGLNCMVDGRCQSALTEDCTEACYSCEDPHDCHGGDFCDPRSVCLDPQCHEDDLKSDHCAPCQSHESVGELLQDEVPRFSQPLRPSQAQAHGGWVLQQIESKAPWYLSQAHQSPVHQSELNGAAFGVTDFAYHCCDVHGNSSADLLHDQNFHYSFPIDPQFADSTFSTELPQSSPVSNNQVYTTNLPDFNNYENNIKRLNSSSKVGADCSSCLCKSPAFQRLEDAITQYSTSHSRSSTISSAPHILSCKWVSAREDSSECGEIFATEKGLHDHIMSLHVGPMGGRGRNKPNKEPMICRWKGCKAAEENKKWSALQHVKDHMVCHSGVRETCENCGKQLRDKKSLKAHKLQCGSDNVQTPIPCPDCGALLKSQSTLKQHMNLHSGKKFACDLCGHTTTDQSNLRKHRKTHDKSKQGRYVCKCHGKPFMNNFNMRRHENNYYSKNGKDAEDDEFDSSTVTSTPGATPVDAMAML